MEFILKYKQCLVGSFGSWHFWIIKHVLGQIDPGTILLLLNISQGLSNEVFFYCHPWVLLLGRPPEVRPNRRKLAFWEGVTRQEWLRHGGCIKGQYGTNKYTFILFLYESCKDNLMESKNTNIKLESSEIDPPVSGFRISRTSSYIFTLDNDVCSNGGETGASTQLSFFAFCQLLHCSDIPSYL